MSWRRLQIVYILYERWNLKWRVIMGTFIQEIGRGFLRTGTKTVGKADISKGAYVVNHDQREVLRLAGITPQHGRTFTLVKLISGDPLTASFYGSERAGSGRRPEYRMGRFVHWLRAGDRLLMATDGDGVFVHKLEAEDLIDALAGSEHEERITTALKKMDREALRQRASQAAAIPQMQASATTSYSRDPAVRAYVQLRSGYRCEMPGCVYVGFLKPDNTRYIEVHHIVPLGEGGEDSICNTAAVCPNCHKVLHFAANRDRLTHDLLQVVLTLEAS
jgi:5-methylcytosine-specific restriction endonuclease McrA